jgi:hypothetical protein
VPAQAAQQTQPQTHGIQGLQLQHGASQLPQQRPTSQHEEEQDQLARGHLQQSSPPSPARYHEGAEQMRQQPETATQHQSEAKPASAAAARCSAEVGEAAQQPPAPVLRLEAHLPVHLPSSLMAGPSAHDAGGEP